MGLVVIRRPSPDLRTTTGEKGENMEPEMIPDPPGFNDLSKGEQIRYLQGLWDRIVEEPGEIPVPESHLALAEDRFAEYRRDPRRARPARDVLDRLAKDER
ncbi:MAG: addiction module protein [Thermodesulfobacteriota bacterium]